MQNNYYSTATTLTRIPSSADANYLYLGPSQQQQQVILPGTFHRRNERIDWRRIAAIDFDRMAYEMDFQTLQDNLEQITWCNIDAETDTRTIDPNFIKLFKMAQITIEYLVRCQDQLTTQLVEYEQLKSKDSSEQEVRQQVDQLKNELDKTKKESKKRRKMLETQQRMLVAQNSNYHTCPVCTHAFLSFAYLQAHVERRHPRYDLNSRREHDIDVEKEIQHLKDELRKKAAELQAQKRAADDAIFSRDGRIRQLEKDIEILNTKRATPNDKFSETQLNVESRLSSVHRHETDVLEENKRLTTEIEQLKRSLRQAEDNLKKEAKYQKDGEYKKENLQREITHSKSVQLHPRALDDIDRLKAELVNLQKGYDEEKLRRTMLEEKMERTNSLLARPPPPITTDRKSSAPSVRSNDTPIQTRPVPTANIILSDYCPNLVERLKENPKYLTKYRGEATKQFIEELEDCRNLGISQDDTRLTSLDFRTKMESVLQTRRNIQNDLPNFERIRDHLIRILDKRDDEQLDTRRSITSIRSTGSKLVTFEDQHQRSKYPSTMYDTRKHFSDQHHDSMTKTTKVQSKTKYNHNHLTGNVESDDDVTLSNANESDDEDTQPTQPGIVANIQPSPRKRVPPSKTATSAIVERPLIQQASTTSKVNQNNLAPARTTNEPYSSDITQKKLLIERKLHEASEKADKSTVNAIAQGSRESLASQHYSDDDNEDNDDESKSLTTIHTNPSIKPSNGHLSQVLSQELVNNNLLSSGDVSQYTYDSLWKSLPNKGSELRRPLTADSAKTSNVDSYDNSEGEESN